MSDSHDELLNTYDPAGVVTGTRGRSDAKREGAILGAVNALLVNARGEVLLQRRPPDKENGDLWDKSVGGHVSAGEDFDTTVVREAGEELFDDGRSPSVLLAASEAEWRDRVAPSRVSSVVLRRQAVQLGLRDVRHMPDGTSRTVTYHVASYLGRTDIAVEDFRPQPSEIVALRYASAEEIDAMLVGGTLSPNMAFLWLTHARALLALVGR